MAIVSWTAADAYFDGILVEQAGSAGAYFDGGSPGAVWDGTAGSSTSSISADGVLLAQPDALGGRMQLTLLWDGTDTAYITRTDPDGTTTPVRQGNPAVLVGGEWIGFDYDCPVGATVTYTAIDPETSETITTTVTMGDTPDGIKSWLKHPGNPALNLLLDVKSPGIDGQVRGARREVLNVIGRKNPIVLSLARQGLDATVTFILDDRDTEAALNAMLDDGSVLLFQPPVASGRGNIYMGVGDVAIKPDPLMSATYREYTLPFDQVDSPTGASGAASNNTWAVLNASWASWAALAGSGKTWADIAVNAGP